MMSAEEARNKTAEKEQEFEDVLVQNSAKFIKNKVLPSVKTAIDSGQYQCTITDINLNKQEMGTVIRFLTDKGYGVSVQDADYVTYLQSACAPRVDSLTITWLSPESKDKKVGFITKLYNKITGGE